MMMSVSPAVSALLFFGARHPAIKLGSVGSVLRPWVRRVLASLEK